MAKVNVISGFLGAGKTTFIKELLEKVFKGQKVVLIENEFGEIGIDGSFLKEAGIEITEMNSGCICCTLVGDFSEALLKVEQQFHPDRIIIEPSGVGKLSDVEKAVKDAPADAHIELESGITVVDAKKARKYLKNFGEFFNNQVSFADTVVLSRTADIDDDKLSDTLTIIRELNPNAVIITTPWDQLDGEVLTRALTEQRAPYDVLMELEKYGDDDDDECECGHHHHHDHDEDEHEHHHHHDHDEDEHEHHHHHDHDEDEHEHHHHHDHDEDEHEHHPHHDHDEDEHEHHHHHDHDHHHHHADEVFTSFGAETARRYEKTELDEILYRLAHTEELGKVLRSKGIVAMADGSWREFDLVPEEIEIRKCQPDYIGKVVVIGTEVDEEEVRKAFRI